MTKYILFFTTIFFVSCKKDYTCSCLEYGSGSQEPIEYYVQVFNSSKSDAKASCKKLDETIGSGDEQVCSLK